MLSTSEETCVILVDAKPESDQSYNLQWAENHHSILKRLEHARYPEQKHQKSSSSPKNLPNTYSNAHGQFGSKNHQSYSPQDTENQYSIPRNYKKEVKFSKRADDSPECSKKIERPARRRSKSENYRPCSKSEDYRPCIYRKTEEHLSTIKTEKKEVKSVKKKPKRDPNSTIFRACLW